MQEIVQSVGIDIGTSTTQLVFSRLVIENLAGSYAVPRVSIVEKEVVVTGQQLLDALEWGARDVGNAECGGYIFCSSAE